MILFQLEAFELYEISDLKVKNERNHGRFRKGHIPFNKGRPMVEWMPDEEKRKRVIECLKLGRKKGNKNLPGNNRIPIVGIKEGKITFFRSASEAAKILKAKGIRINERNIRCVCNEETKNGYIRRHAGGYRWFNEKDYEKWKDLILLEK